jgi:hypothetical protein
MTTSSKFDKREKALSGRGGFSLFGVRAERARTGVPT